MPVTWNQSVNSSVGTVNLKSQSVSESVSVSQAGQSVHFQSVSESNLSVLLFMYEVSAATTESRSSDN